MLDLNKTAQAGSPVVFHDYAPDVGSFRQALLDGLSAARKSIPCRFLYDAQGSALFDQICELEEYYPTRTEIGMLRAQGGEMAERIGPDCQLIELGGASSLKAKILLDALDRPGVYMPVDISREHMQTAVRRLHDERPDLAIHAICADYGQPFALPVTEAGGRRVAFFPGSTIGNLNPGEAIDFLSDWAAKLGRGGAMLIGVDLRKDPELIRRAYDDARGVTAAFSKNVLARANRELDADFDLDSFAHRARYDTERGCIVIHLESLRAQTARVGSHRLDFAAGEQVHIEDSYKYTLAGFRALAMAGGFMPIQVWTDPDALFSIHYLEATSPAPRSEPL